MSRIAVDRHSLQPKARDYLIVQHGSYQCVPSDEQPELEVGYVFLHRGIGDATVFHFPARGRAGSDPQTRIEWDKYVQLQLEILIIDPDRVELVAAIGCSVKQQER